MVRANFCRRFNLYVLSIYKLQRKNDSLVPRSTPRGQKVKFAHTCSSYDVGIHCGRHPLGEVKVYMIVLY